MEKQSIVKSYLESGAIVLSRDNNKNARYVDFVSKLLLCARCPLRSNHPWPASGNLDSKVMIVGEAPSPNRSSFENFSEKSRNIVDLMLKEMNLSRKDVYITNAIKCSFVKLTKDMKESLLKNCIDYLIQEIDIVHPKVVVALGGTAEKALTHIRNNVRSDFMLIHFPHPMTVVYGSIKLETYLEQVRKKWTLVRYLI
ncbi:MAG: hypothetical protein DSO07_05230 [Thermoproteota archaeon]|nr:MAG: hypothetical protein DSO07_05230 [Candidatus Korarchaeota archaeon]